MTTPTLDAVITLTPPLSVKQFYSTQPSTPGNVGVCLSGGGSRALCAGMGQLQALSYLGLLDKVKALATVSGGSWLGVPYVYLPAKGPGDSTFLGSYVADQGTMTLAQLQSLPAGNAGVPVSCGWFSPDALALSAFVLRNSLGVPANLLWQTLVALNILSASQLFESQSGTDLTPADTFSYNQTTWDQIVSANPALKSETAYLFADAVNSERIQRPFLICNVAMLMSELSGDLQMPAAVQVTAFTTGVFGAPQGHDGNGLTPGGGGVTSFAFNSNFVSSTDDDAATVSQSRQWSLTDAVGSSSAFFALELANQLAIWESDLGSFLKTLLEKLQTILKWIENHLPLEAQVKAKHDVNRWASVASVEDYASLNLEFPCLSDMIPQYDYWPVTATKPTTNPQATQFADGGNLENTGLASMVAYSDIDSVIAFINSSTPLQAGQYGVLDANQGFVAGTNVIVDESVPPLFGYQPYDTSTGYVLYAKLGSTPPARPQFANNQVFSSDSFATFLQGLWNASLGSSGQLATSPAIFSQQNLTVQKNPSFGVTGGQTITVVWCYLSYAQSWPNLFSNNQAILTAIKSLVSANKFPNYSTKQTQLTPTQINLLANFTGWSIVSTDRSDNTFSGLFASAPA
jgi:hypothetical protein